MREVDAQGMGKDRKDCMKQFRTAWFSADSARFTEFLEMKRRGPDRYADGPTPFSVTVLTRLSWDSCRVAPTGPNGGASRHRPALPH
jgi:hypothetical protein